MNRWFWIAVEGLRYWWALLPKDLDSGMPRSLWVDAVYLEWRLDTAYGGGKPRPSRGFMFRDIVTFLEWRRRMRVTMQLRPPGPHPVRGDDVR